MKKSHILKISYLTLAGCLVLSGCGVRHTAVDPSPAATDAPADNMVGEDQWKGGQAQDGTQGGYEIGYEANTAVMENLAKSHDGDTAIEIQADPGELAALTGNGRPGQDAPDAPGQPVEIAPEPTVAAPAPLPLILKPEAPGTAESRNGSCVIDYSNACDGYFMSAWLGNLQKIKLQSTGPTGITYTYDLYGNEWAAFPLSDGNGHYDVRVMQNVGGTKYAVAGSAAFDAAMADEFAPFLRPNQYVDYEHAVNTTAMASELCRGRDGALDKVAAVYDWVVANLSYDHDKAASVQAGYLPDLDAVLAARKGICFDYASMMAGMLRSQGVACRLVVGYAGQAYHAWISVYVDGQGWVDGVIFFDGRSWQRMDPTFASNADGDEGIMAYIGDGSNYSARYLY